jgi:type IV pilus assembly protein PilO
MRLSSGKNSGPLLVTALLLALLFAVYYYVVLPKQNEADRLQKSVDRLSSEVSTTREQIALNEAGNSGTADNEFAIHKKLPPDREIDELLLSLEEIEYVSGSRILGISFNNYDDLVSSSGLGNSDETQEEIPADVTTAESNSAPADQQEGTVPVSPMSVEALPANLKLITFQIDVESPDDEQLQQFIEEIEGMERVMHIDTIEYSLPGEEDAFTDEVSLIVSASIQVTTFYFE